MTAKLKLYSTTVLCKVYIYLATKQIRRHAFSANPAKPKDEANPISNYIPNPSNGRTEEKKTRTRESSPSRSRSKFNFSLSLSLFDSIQLCLVSSLSSTQWQTAKTSSRLAQPTPTTATTAITATTTTITTRYRHQDLQPRIGKLDLPRVKQTIHEYTPFDPYLQTSSQHPRHQVQVHSAQVQHPPRTAISIF